MKVTIKILTLLLLYMCTGTLYAQFTPEEQNQIDSLTSILANNTSHDTSLATAYIGLSEILYVSNLDTMIPLCTKARELSEKALNERPSILVAKSFKTSLAKAFNNIGYIHDIQGDIDVALEYYLKSLNIQLEIKDKQGMATSYSNIGGIYENQGDIPLALDYYDKSLKIKNEIKDMRGMANTYNNIWYIHDKQGELSLALDYHYKSLKINEEIQDKEGMAASYSLIGRYAKRIQEAIFPSMATMHKALKDGFVLYKPKNVVAGDFYWLEQYDNKIYFAAADCTDHGVPGAMVSVVCSNALSKSLLEEKITSTGKLLDKTREIVIQCLAKSGEEVKDGMDISLCAIDFSTGQMQWSGANNPLWIIRHGELIEYKYDKQPIGMHDNIQPFTTHEIVLQKNNTFYIITDGYQDQFGGPKGKKFRPLKLKEKLLAIQNQNMSDQKIILDNEFENWKGLNEQIDDVCIIGVKI